MPAAVLKNFINIIYPALCPICKNQLIEKKGIICHSCFNAIERNVPPFCKRCGRHLQRARCGHCQKYTLHFQRAFSPCCYRGKAAEIIHLFKYRRKMKLIYTISRIMHNFINIFRIPVQNFNMMAAIPLHPAKLREREFNQAELIAENISGAFNIPLSSNNLIKICNRNTQTKLGFQERFLNMNGVFEIKNKKEITGKNILLIDDVLTTGATCSEASRILKEAGAKNVSVLTFAS
ncbi:MAG: hypothetical protein COV72_01320 [Candidatus Omnitrophica bacterium CG11_big_fil_rev_8_21_14_0_20_42_13]|uniref:Phosphoribosyltransferase domain-containing protein n=1 Tax=Candidatus Ghiorseimicrobium undicola TaxID=1974746 RepID=A0A2H0LZK9_9BACT|nr:MAG: hypothetical protein COV72_01320 [Candidatus Omnitrophica bacterium CG11_big_fil_rev_8_21_14_0_20_42_13]